MIPEYAPTPQPGPTGVYVPNPVPQGGIWGIIDTIINASLFGTIAALVIVAGVGYYILNRLPWKVIGIVSIVIIILLAVKLKGG